MTLTQKRPPKPKTHIHWKDWQGEMFVSPDNDLYYDSLYDFGEQWFADNGEDGPDNYYKPTFLKDCRKEYGSFPSAKCIAEEFLEYTLLANDRGARYCSTGKPAADELWEGFLEDLYFHCDDDIPDEAGRGLTELQAELDRFERLNRHIWLWFGLRSWYRSNWCVGLARLQRALSAATAANRHCYVFYEASDRVIDLDDEFWRQFN